MVFHIMTIELLIEVYNFTEEKTVSLFKIKADHCIWEIKRIITMQMQIYTNMKRVCDKNVVMANVQ